MSSPIERFEDILKSKDAEIERLNAECGELDACATDYRLEIDRISIEHGDMNVACVQYEKDIERLTIDVERWKSIASQIESDWIPANRKLSADVAKLRHEADGLLIRNEKLEKAGNIPYMSAPERIGDEWVLVKQRHLISLDEVIAEVNE